MSDYDRPHDLCTLTGVPRSTGARWVREGYVRALGEGKHRMWHRGDFEVRMADISRSGWASYTPLPPRFEDPVPAGQCHNLTCDQPATTLSALHLCTKHEMILRSQKGALVRKPTRCAGCQTPLGIHNKTGRCTACSARRNGQRAVA